MNTKNKIIYILEDSKIISSILKKILSAKPGNIIHEHADGGALLLSLSRQIPDIIFMDYYLDTVNRNEPTGEDIFLEIKATHPDIKFIMLTGITDNGKLNHFRSIGFNEVINKNEPELFNRLLDCLNK